MDINNKKQYNQGIGKYKILSSTAGVGSSHNKMGRIHYAVEYF